MSKGKKPEMNRLNASIAGSAMVGERSTTTARLRLYVARPTPNSIRAERNLSAVLKEIGDEAGVLELEIIDVFAHPRRAVTDSIMITPTLIGIADNTRLTLIGDLADADKLRHFLQSLRSATHV